MNKCWSCKAKEKKLIFQAPNGIGFRHLTKYYKIVGPVGEGKDAFKEEEEKEVSQIADLDVLFF